MLDKYAPKARAYIAGISPQALTMEKKLPNPIIEIARKQKEAEALVASENVDAKQKLASIVADGLEVEPKTYEEALARPDGKHWQQSINSEGSSLLANKMWKLMQLPTGKRALSCRWLFKFK